MLTSPMRRQIVLGASAAAVLGLPRLGMAQQDFPNRPVRLLVGFTAGGGIDVVSRLLAQRMADQLGQPFVVDNRPGASGAIAAEAAARAAPDGYTLVMGDSTMLITKLLQPKLAFDPLTSFTPIAGTFALPLVLAVNNNFPAKNPQELVAALKANPGKFSYASVGTGSVHHLGFEQFKSQVNAFAVHIPYRGSAQIIPDLYSGQVSMAIVSVSVALPQVRAGRMRIVGLFSPTSVPGVTQPIPMLSEVAPGFEVTPRLFLLAPSGTPEDVVQRLSAAAKTALTSQDIAQTAAPQGAVISYASPGQMMNDMRTESSRWARVIRTQNVFLE